MEEELISTGIGALIGSKRRRYLAHGTATDFMYDIVKVPMAFTFEIYGDTAASSKDCFKMFNPVDLTTFNRVLNDLSSAFLTIFKLGPLQLDGNHLKENASGLDKFVSIDEYLDGYLMERRNIYGKKMEVLDVGMQGIRTYFRLFLLSSVLLLFMFCSRIAKGKSNRPIVSALSIRHCILRYLVEQFFLPIVQHQCSSMICLCVFEFKELPQNC